MPTPVPLNDIDIIPITGLWSPWVSTTGLGWDGGTDASVSLNTRFTGDAGGTYIVQVMNGGELTTYTMTNSGSIDVPLGGDAGQTYTGSVSVRIMNLSPHPLQQVEISAPNNGGYQLILPNAEDQIILRNIARSLGSNPAEDATLEEYETAIASALDANGDGLPTLLEIFNAFHDAGETFMTNIILNAIRQAENSCFGAGTPIDMWPLDEDMKLGPSGIYDQDEVRAKIWKKPIELIQVGDLVVSFDANENLVPGPVTRTFQNDSKILLDFHGTRVTPGHVYYRPDSKKPYKFETLIDVLRDDGVIQHQDGTLIRAATNVPVGDPCDGYVQAITGTLKADGTLLPKQQGRIRLGTRFLVGNGKERKAWAVADLIKAGGGVVGDDEFIRVGDGEPMPFHWEFGDTLPNPEDFVLACSGTTLEDIYKTAEWESQGPRLPAPMVLDGGPVQPLSGDALSAMPRNEPLDVTHAPIATQPPQRTLNRKQRKAMEAKKRKSGKANKPVVG